MRLKDYCRPRTLMLVLVLLLASPLMIIDAQATMPARPGLPRFLTIELNCSPKVRKLSSDTIQLSVGEIITITGKISAPIFDLKNFKYFLRLSGGLEFVNYPGEVDASYNEPQINGFIPLLEEGKTTEFSVNIKATKKFEYAIIHLGVVMDFPHQLLIEYLNKNKEDQPTQGPFSLAKRMAEIDRIKEKKYPYYGRTEIIVNVK